MTEQTNVALQATPNAVDDRPAPADRYLPALPDGWTWAVTAQGPDNQSIDITPAFVSDGTGPAQLHGYEVQLAGGGQPVFVRALREGTEKAVAVAKALGKAAAARRALEAQERAVQRALKPAADKDTTDAQIAAQIEARIARQTALDG